MLREHYRKTPNKTRDLRGIDFTRDKIGKKQLRRQEASKKI
jgi:hypothetical protein